MELNENLDQLRKQGLGLAAVSYDSPAILKHFADRQKIRFPLLSDAGSKTIRAFGVLNETVPAANPFFGVPHPVTFVVGSGGKVQSKYFEDDFRERQTLAGLMARDYGVAPAAAPGSVEAKHITIKTAASTSKVRSGQRILLSLDIGIPERMHLYAPGVTGYIAVDWKIEPTPKYEVFNVAYPASKKLHLPAIGETVPVYMGRLRLMRDIKAGPDKVLQSPLVVEGTFRYQACDDKQCFLPESVPVRWTLEVEPHDRQRVPKEIQTLK